MRIRYKTIIAGFLFLNGTMLFGQDPVEVKMLEISACYREAMQKTAQLGNENPQESLRLFSEALEKTSQPYDRFNLIFWGLADTYASMGLYPECLDVLRLGQKEGLFFPFTLGDRAFPSWVELLKGLEGFEAFLELNNRLKNQAQEQSRPEYIVQIPQNYSKTRKYPLMLVFTGGWGAHISLALNWQSSLLSSQYVVAYLQGTMQYGSFLKGNNPAEIGSVIEIARRIRRDYAVDSTRIVLAAQSAGAHIVLNLLLDELVPVKGIVLAFPGTPRELDESKIRMAADRGVRIVVLAGEKDVPRVERSKEMAALFSRLGLACRIEVFPGKGHEFPDDFPSQIDRSLDFLFDRTR